MVCRATMETNVIAAAITGPTSKDRLAERTNKDVIEKHKPALRPKNAERLQIFMGPLIFAKLIIMRPNALITIAIHPIIEISSVKKIVPIIAVIKISHRM